MIRIFEFKNSYIGKNSQSVSAEYNVFGYFDGLTMRTFQDDYMDDFCMEYQPFELKRLDEKCDYFDIVGFCENEDSDKKFWKKGQDPYIFISCVRLKKPSVKIDALISEMKSEYGGIGYTSVDNSDFVFCIRRETYREGYVCLVEYFNRVREVDETNNIEKIFSVVAVSQVLLDVLAGKGRERWNEDDIKNAGQEFALLDDEEIISCSLRGVIKDMEKVKNFVNLLEKHLQIRIPSYDIVGSEDVVLGLPKVSSKAFLKLYGYMGLLTHDNPVYTDAFYNIRTDILSDL